MLTSLATAVVLAVGAAEEAAPSVTVDVGSPRTSSWGSYPGHSGHPRLRQAFSLHSGPIGYNLTYSCCTHKSHAPGVATPEGYIGMPGPSNANWYHNGFMYIVVNGKDIGLTKLSAARASGAGRQGGLQLIWDRTDAVVEANFLMRAGDPALYFEARLRPRAKIESLAVRLVAYPVEYTHSGERWVVTPKRGVRQSKTAAIDPKAEPWLLVQDHKLVDPAVHSGGCGLAFLGAELAGVKVSVMSYPVTVTCKAKPGAKRLRLAIWDFPKRANAEARRYVESVVDDVRKRLAELDFANPLLEPGFWAAKRAELVPLVVKARQGFPKLGRKVDRLVADVDALHATMAAAVKQRKPAPIAAENKLLAILNGLDETYWKLRLAALFADE